MTSDTFNQEERENRLRLIRTDHIGPVTFHQLLGRYGSATDALHALPDIQTGRRRFTPPSYEQIAAELEMAERIGARYVSFDEPAYPGALLAIHDPPPMICTCGDHGLLQKKAVAIVGARNASAAGRKIATMLATDLGTADLTVVSGLARGIDGAAHQAALKTGTIAVVAGGLDVIYPPEHADLTREIARDGLIISEMPPGYRPTGRDFPKRNRIISGLASGIIVVEAAQKSGTLITARFALEQGREVFAVPGSPLDPRSQGTNKLIRDGATLIETAEDVLESINSTLFVSPALKERMPSPEPEILSVPELESASRHIHSLLSFTPIHRDELVRISNIPAAELNQALLELVLSGQAEEHTGGRYTRTSG